MRIGDWSSDVCSSDLEYRKGEGRRKHESRPERAGHEGPAAWHGDEGCQRTGRERAEKAAGLAATRSECGHRQFEQTGKVQGNSAGQDEEDADNDGRLKLRSEEHTSEIKSIMRISYADIC